MGRALLAPVNGKQMSSPIFESEEVRIIVRPRKPELQADPAAFVEEILRRWHREFGLPKLHDRNKTVAGFAFIETHRANLANARPDDSNLTRSSLAWRLTDRIFGSLDYASVNGKARANRRETELKRIIRSLEGLKGSMTSTGIYWPYEASEAEPDLDRALQQDLCVDNLEFGSDPLAGRCQKLRS
ncbi:hypothetical protein N8071_00770 [bacterium]|nr:hypothetical protein [bacterium]